MTAKEKTEEEKTEEVKKTPGGAQFGDGAPLGVKVDNEKGSTMSGNTIVTPKPANPFPAPDENGSRTLTGETAPYFAFEWAHNHNDAWRDMVRKAFAMKQRCGRVSMQLLVEECRYKHYPSFDKTNEVFKVSNTLAAALARLMVESNPQLSGCFLFRASASDEQFARLATAEGDEDNEA